MIICTIVTALLFAVVLIKSVKVGNSIDETFSFAVDSISKSDNVYPEVNDVVAPYPSNDIANMERANKNMNVMKYALVALTTSCSIGLPSNFIFLTLLG